ncbi:MAG: oleate hydratase [Ruminococcus sp.]
MTSTFWRRWTLPAVLMRRYFRSDAEDTLCEAAVRWKTISECLWDLFHSIPSLEKPGASRSGRSIYWLNKHDPNYSLCRATVNRGKDAHTDGKFNFEPEGLHGDHEARSSQRTRIFTTRPSRMYSMMRF